MGIIMGRLYSIIVIKNGLVIDRFFQTADGFSISTYIREMLAHGYGLDIRLIEEAQ